MSGTLVALTANHGLQDQIIFDEPDVSFFKASFRKITNFQVEPLLLPTNFSSAQEFPKMYVTIQRSGDLVGEMYIQYKMKGNSSTHQAAYHDVREVCLEIGGQVIDRQSGAFMKAFNDIMGKADKDERKLLTGSICGTDRYAYYPLKFFNCLSPSLYIPAISLQFHDIRVSMDMHVKPDKIDTIDLLVNYVYLDEEERKRMAREQMEILIPQVQTTSIVTDKTVEKIDLPFNHPVSCLLWSTDQTDMIDASGMETVVSAQLRLNHHLRFGRQAMPGNYFRLVQPYEKFGKIPEHTYGYSFALDATSMTQPTGSCNFSRIDSAVLDLELATGVTKVDVFAINWNVLRIFSGLGGLSYSN